MKNVSRYHPLLVVLHWLLAFLIIGALWFGVTVLAHTANANPAKIEMLQKHMGAGLAILVLMLARLLVRSRTAHPATATAGNPWLDRLAFVSHRLLYVAVLGQAGSGLIMALQTRLPQIVYGHQGTLPPDFWAFPVRYAHYGFSRLLIVLIALHIAGALYHTFVLRDRLLRRMGFRPAPHPGRSSRQPENSRGAVMNYLIPAQLLSLFVFATMAVWYAVPKLNARDRVAALVPLLWVHVFRFLALQAFRAQADGFPASDAHVIKIVVGDLAGMAIALAALYALHFRARIGIWLAWLLVGEFVYDFVTNIRSGIHEHLFGQSRGMSWLVVGVYVPLLIVTTILLVWQLYARRHEALNVTAEGRAHNIAHAQLASRRHA
jgi:cytochrome b561